MTNIRFTFAVQFIEDNVMTKAEIVKEVSKSTGIENATVSAVVEGFMAAVKGALAKEERGI